MIEISKELQDDMVEVEELLDLTFGPGRNTLSSYRFRDGVQPIKDLCLIMRDEYDVLVGSIRFWPILIGFQRLPGLLLGPLGVHSTRQGEGLGEVLIRTTLKKAKILGWSRVLLVGDIKYYERFGFSANLIEGIYLKEKNSNERLLGTELTDGSMLNLSGPLFKFIKKL